MTNRQSTDVVGYIARAANDDDLRALAARYFAEMAQDMLAKRWGRRPEVFPSDYGSCALQLWAAFHGKEDPAAGRDPIDEQVARLDLGSLAGAWEACLLKAGAEASRVRGPRVARDWYVTLEHEPGRGHIDALMEYADERVVVEFKSQYNGATRATSTIEKASASHKLQASDYAEQVGADEVVLVYFAPAAPKGERMRQISFDPRPYFELVAQERIRLEASLGDEPPAADPSEPWQCFTCAYTECSRNKRKPNLSALTDEIFGVIA